MFKNNTGITLIALVVTIIVLLILAGVSIAMLTGDNGILTQATEAKEKTQIAELKERLQLIGIEARQKDKELIDGEEYIIEYEEKIKQDEIFKTAQKVERENLKITVITKEGYIFEITEEDVEYIGKTNEDLSILNISIKCSEVSNKLSTLTAEVNKNNDRKYDYKIYVNNKEIETITTKEKSFSYEIQTEFGNSQIYVKTIANDKEVQSNQVEIEDNSVRTIEELRKFRDEVNAGNTYEGKIITQIANIDMKNENWESIGNENTHFKGTYDGKGNSINNIYIENTNNNQGLFGINEGTIKNVGIESGTIKGGYNTGGIVGKNINGNIERCYNKAEINAKGFLIGGICGDNEKGTIIECYNEGNITGIVTIDYGNTCGIAGNNLGGMIKACYNKGNITTITNKLNTRASGVTDTSFKGKNSKVISCYNTGLIKIESNNLKDTVPVSAGVVSQIEENSIVENCYNIGKTIIEAANGTQANELRRAGITGYLFETATIRNCYWMTGTANQGWGADSDQNADKSGIIEKSSEEMKKLENTLGSDFKKDTNNINNGYPILYWQ